ncbi:MAG: zinc-binding dehydrogenase [Deltaproteobacteria bacterium]
MKATVIREFGDANVLKYEDIDTPNPREGHVLVKVLASGVNRLDHYIREGSITPELKFPHILGADASGEVADIGLGVSGFSIGERVILVPGYPTNVNELEIRPTIAAPSFALPGLHISGTYAQYIEVPAYALIKDDTDLEPEEVATLPVVLGTAVHAVKKIGEVKKGDNVLVQSGASGSGSMQIQVAKALGAKVASTIRKENKYDFVKKAGADLIINVNEDDFVEKVKEWTDGNGADVVIDNLGGDILARSIEAVKPAGVIVAYGFAAGPEVKFDIRSLFFFEKKLRGTMASDKEDLVYGLELIRERKIKPLLDQAIPLKNASKAHRLISENRISGNIVLLPWAA